MTQPPRILIAAGGTGGHIAPALALADTLEVAAPGCVVSCVTGAKPFERSMWERAQRRPHILEGAALVVTNPLKLAKGLVGGARAVWQAFAVLAAERPNVVVGMGGYVAAPMAFVAAVRRIPVYLHEQNAVPGRANRFLARFATHVSAAHQSALPLLRAPERTQVGNPLGGMFYRATREDGLSAFRLSDDRPILLVIGGSQGAEGLNQAVFEAGQELARTLPADVVPQILWATGESNLGTWKARVDAESGLDRVFKLHAFIAGMPAAYACADLAITRAGAGTLAELAATGLPSILIPYPHARDDHQTLNARQAVEAGAAVIMQERELQPGRLAHEIEALLGHPRRMLRMSARASSLATPEAGPKMASLVLDLARRHQKRRGSPAEAEKPARQAVLPQVVTSMAATSGHAAS